MPSIAVIAGRRRRRGNSGPVILVADTFTRADSAVTLGSTETGSLGPKAWTPLDASTWGVSSNQAYCPAGTATDKGAVTVDVGASDVTVQATFATVAGGDVRIVFRASDLNNQWFAIGSTTGGNYRLFKWSAGALVGPVATWATAPVNGDVVAAICSGSSITVTVNGVSRLTTSDAFNSTATKHGLGINTAAGTTARWDNFSVTTP